MVRLRLYACRTVQSGIRALEQRSQSVQTRLRYAVTIDLEVLKRG